MRLPRITALVVCATLLALAATIGPATAPARAGNSPFHFVPGALTRAEMPARLNLSLLAPDARAAAIHALAVDRAVPVKPATGAKVTGWVVDGLGYLWGIDKSGTVVTDHNDCVEPGLGRVDHRGNLLVACMVGGQTSGVPGNINVYVAGNTSAKADVVLKDAAGYLPFDVFEDNAGDIYAVNAIQFVCGSAGCSVNAGNIVRWSVGHQRTGALPDRKYSDANLFQLESADIDAAGTIYVSGFTAAGAPEVDSLAGRAATNLNISLVYPGGVYVVSPNGSAPVLSLMDQAGSSAPTLYEFGLPISPGASPIVSDVTPQNFEKRCDPVAAGYAPAGALASLGLLGCKANAQGAPASGQWTVRQNLDYVQPFEGLYVPSDK